MLDSGIAQVEGHTRRPSVVIIGPSGQVTSQKAQVALLARLAGAFVEPGRYVDGVEAEQVAPFDERDAPLENEPADVSNLDAEMLGDRVDVDQVGELG
jgi:hypothetical protein